MTSEMHPDKATSASYFPSFSLLRSRSRTATGTSEADLPPAKEGSSTRKTLKSRLTSLASGGLGFLKGVSRGAAGVGAGVCALLCLTIIPPIVGGLLMIQAESGGMSIEEMHRDSRGGHMKEKIMFYAGAVIGFPVVGAYFLGKYAASGGFK